MSTPIDIENAAALVAALRAPASETSVTADEFIARVVKEREDAASMIETLARELSRSRMAVEGVSLMLLEEQGEKNGLRHLLAQAERDAAIARAEAAEAERDEARAKARDEAAEFIFGVLEGALGNPLYNPCDGTETWDGDVAGTVYRILNASGVRDEDTGELATTRAEAAEAQVERLREALAAIVARSENGELGTSKVQDMARLAREAQVERLREALAAIVARSENGELGTSKVQDMARLARAALAGKEPADG